MMNLFDKLNTLDFDKLNVLEFHDKDILFQQRELGSVRTSFEMEKKLFSFISDGKPNEMVAYYKNMLKKNPKMLLSVGKLSQDDVRQTQYLAVSLIAIVCRVAICAGAPESIAYSMSDESILRIDKLKTSKAVLMEEVKTIYQYAVLVETYKKNANYSKEIRQCIEYISANLHSEITVDALVNLTPLSKAHLGKKFKTEVGKSISDYILEQRINEAKSMLTSGKSYSQIAYTLHFCSQSYFIRQFKKITGETPAKFKSRL
ncbi:MAG: helix-turn-helix domain-containing protein [Cellulosilyticaceae bacterium]